MIVNRIEIYPDALSPIGTLSREERTKARLIAQASPDALWAAVEAALGHGEATLELMERLIREVRK